MAPLGDNPVAAGHAPSARLDSSRFASRPALARPGCDRHISSMCGALALRQRAAYRFSALKFVTHMKKVRLICWNAELAKDHAKVLKAAGFAADRSPMQGSGIVRQMRGFAPDAVVIDLDRLPSQGREMAIMLRSSKST